MPRMDEDTLKSIIRSEEQSAISYITGSSGKGDSIANQRKLAHEAYMGELYGNEKAGLSSYVSLDVFSVVESTLPSLMEIFTGSDDMVKFGPRGPEDGDIAKQATALVNYVFMEENNGFDILYTMFKDGLIQKTGFSKTFWDETEEVIEEKYEGITTSDVAKIIDDTDFELLEHEEELLETGETLHNVTIRRTEKEGHIVVEAVPSEEIILSPRTRNIRDGQNYIAHRTNVTVSEAVSMGIDKELAISTATAGEEDFTVENQTGYPQDNLDFGDGLDLDPMRRRVIITEHYLRVDYDGDDFAELRKITTLGHNAQEIVSNEAVDEIPFAMVTPIPLPHQAIGLGQADIMRDLQKTNSNINRQLINNLYMTANQRNLVIEGQVNMSDLLTNRPAANIRMKSQGAVTPLITPQVGPQAYQALEHFTQTGEVRTGVRRQNTGLDAQSLNATATASAQVQDHSQMRIKMIARIYANQLVPMFERILGLSIKNQDKAKAVRIRGEWVEVDPSEWKNNFDVKINVGIGTGNKERTLQQLLTIYEMQKEASGMGMANAEDFLNTYEKVIELSELKNPENYFSQPPPPQPEPPQQDPNMALVEMQGQMAQMQAQMNFQLKTQEQQADQQLKAQDQDFDQQQSAQDQAFNQDLKEKELMGKLAITREEKITKAVIQ